MDIHIAQLRYHCVSNMSASLLGRFLKLDLVKETGHSTVIITDDGKPRGKFIGLVTDKDYRISRDNFDAPIDDYMTPKEKVVWAYEGISLSEANDIIWENKIACLPILDKEERLKYLVFRRDYEERKNNPNSLLDENKRYIVGAGINTRDYEERIGSRIVGYYDIYQFFGDDLRFKNK